MTAAVLAVGAAAVAALALGGYLAGTGRLRRAGRRWPARRTAAAVAAALLLAGAGLLTAPWSGAPWSGTAEHPAGHVAGAVPHMLQHVVLGMVLPLAVVAARPLTLLLGLSPLRARPLLSRAVRGPVAHVLSHPVLAAVPAVVGVHVLLLTPLHARTLDGGWVHGLVLVHTVLAGTWSAWALVGGDPAAARSSLLVRLGTVAVVAGTHAHLATLLYARAPALPPGAPHPAEDLRQAALVMYYAGDAAELLLAGAVVVVWYRARARAGQRTGRPPVTATLAPDT